MNAIDVKFLELFPDGINDDQWVKLGKKHNPNKVIDLLNSDLSKTNLSSMIKNNEHDKIMEIFTKAVKTVSVVSVFEKVAFTNYAKKGGSEEFSKCLYNFMYKYNEKSFEDFVNVLLKYKNDGINPAKWPVVSFIKAYQNSDEYVLVKPNTVKKVAQVLEWDIEYKSVPNITTYENVINMIKNYRETSDICSNENLMITQAVLFIACL